MRKGILLTTGVVVVAVAAVPYYMGMRAETLLMKEVNSQPFPSMTLAIKDYQRGWSSSTATLEATFTRPSRRVRFRGRQHTVPRREMRFDMPMKVSHGPLFFRNNRLGFGIAHATAFRRLPVDEGNPLAKFIVNKDDAPSMRINTTISLAKHFNYKLEIPAFSLQDPSGATKVQWRGLEGYFSRDNHDEQTQGGMNFFGLSVTSAPMSAVGDIKSMSYEYRRTDNGNGAGATNFRFSIPAITSTIKGQSAVTLQDFNVEVQKDGDAQTFNSHLGMSLAKLVMVDQTFANGSIDINVKNLDTQAWRQLTQAASDANNPSVSNLKQRKSLFSMLSTIPKLLSHGAVLSVDKVALQTPDGLVKMQGELKLPGKAVMNNPFALMMQAEMQMSMQAPQAVAENMLTVFFMRQLSRQQALQRVIVKQMSQSDTETADAAKRHAQSPMTPKQLFESANNRAKGQVQQWLQQGYLHSDGSVVKMDLRFQGGQMRINGRAVSR